MFSKILGLFSKKYVFSESTHILAQTKIDKDKIIIAVDPEELPWLDVVENEIRYGLRINDLYWAKQEVPKNLDAILAYIKSNTPIFRFSCEGKSTTLEEWLAEDKNRQEEMIITWEKDVKPYLERELEKTIPEHITHIDDTSMHIFYIDNPQNWICKVKYSKYQISYIELPSKKRLTKKDNGELYKKDRELLQKAFE